MTDIDKKALENKDAISMEATEEMQKKSEEIIKKLDKESSTRTFSGLMKKIFFVSCILISCYHLYTATFGPPLTLIHRSIHVAMMLALTFLMYPLNKKASFTTPSILDWLLVAASWAAPFYISTGYQGFVERAGNANFMDMCMATLLVLLVLEASRRVNGNVLSILSLVFIAYGLWGRSMPGMFMHRGYDWTSLSNHFFANTEGIYGTSVSVSASYIFLFILFGAVMSKSGMGQLFNDMALGLAGHTKGGPAKVSVWLPVFWAPLTVPQ